MRCFAAAAATVVLAFASCVAQDPPQSPKPNELRERAYAAEVRGKYSAAADAFLQLASVEPDDPTWAVAAGRCLGRSARFKEAIDLLDRARTTFPGSLEVPSMLAKTLLLQAESERDASNAASLCADAAEIAESVLQHSPDDEDARLVLAQAKYVLGDHAAAVAAAEEAVRRHPKRAGAHVLIGRIAMDRFRELSAEHSRDKPTGQAEADLVAAIDAARQRAKSAFSEAAKIDPTRAHPHVMLGQIALLDKRTDVARTHFTDAIATDPDVAIDHQVFEMDTTWQQRRDLYENALRRYSARAGATEEKKSTLLFHAGRACYEGGDWAAARTLFLAARAANADATNTDYYLAFSAYQLGDHDGAETHAAKFAAVGAPAFADVVRSLGSEKRGQIGAILQFLADRAYEKGRIDASRDLNHVIACLKDSADAWNNHAFLCRETKRYEEALASYLHAQEKEPDSPQLLNDTGVILQYHLPGADNLRKAKGLYERAIQIADKLLADSQTQSAIRERTAKARADAMANLAAMR